MAFVPLINGLWWAKNTKWVSLGCALFFLIPFSYAYGISEGIYRLLESILLDFIPFIVLLYGLYATAGGIMIHGKLAGTPIINSLILFVGTVMASWIGTTGAAMLFIRPLNRVNEWLRSRHMKSRLILQVHDELLVETAVDELEEVREMMVREMQNAAELKVRLEVDIHDGKNWYEAK